MSNHSSHFFNEESTVNNYRKAFDKAIRCSRCNKSYRCQTHRRYKCDDLNRFVSANYVCDLHEVKVKVETVRAKTLQIEIHKELKCTCKKEYKDVRLRIKISDELMYRYSDRGERVLVFKNKLNKMVFLAGMKREVFKCHFKRDKT